MIPSSGDFDVDIFDKQVSQADCGGELMADPRITQPLVVSNEEAEQIINKLKHYLVGALCQLVYQAYPTRAFSLTADEISKTSLLDMIFDLNSITAIAPPKEKILFIGVSYDTASNPGSVAIVIQYETQHIDHVYPGEDFDWALFYDTHLHNSKPGKEVPTKEQFIAAMPGTTFRTDINPHDLH